MSLFLILRFTKTGVAIQIEEPRIRIIMAQKRMNPRLNQQIYLLSNLTFDPKIGGFVQNRFIFYIPDLKINCYCLCLSRENKSRLRKKTKCGGRTCYFLKSTSTKYLSLKKRYYNKTLNRVDVTVSTTEKKNRHVL